MTNEQRGRLEAMIIQDQKTWDLSEKDVVAIMAALAEIDRVAAERDALIAAWPTINQSGKESGGPTVYGPIDGHWYQQTIGGNWPTPNPGGRPTREAAVRCAAGIETKGDKS